MFNRIRTHFTNRIHELPILVLMPHSRCNCRCVMCDIWKANSHKQEISTDVLERHLATFRKLRVKRVTLSGGEALMHSNLWKFCELLRGIDVRTSLLSTGVTLKLHAADITSWCNDVIVSLDGSQPVHDMIRNIPNAFKRLSEGVEALKNAKPDFLVTGRCVLQKLNYHDFENIIETARRVGLDQISFLAADVSTTAFNREVPWEEEKRSSIQLTAREVARLESSVRNSFTKYKKEYASKFIAESPRRMLDIVNYYKALLSLGPFPGKKCNAPWVSAVVESDGNVRPCFFHEPYGNLHDGDFDKVINSDRAVAFRKNLDVNTNTTCERCVCSLHVGLLRQ